MTVEQMREALIKRYPGETWAEKVKNMSDNQVIAIHSKFANSRKG